MKKLLLVIDMQVDFITGSLGSPQAQKIVPAVKAKIEQYKQNGDKIILTRDTHDVDYYNTQEGRFLPVPHCILGTAGHEITPELNFGGYYVFNKPTFGSLELAEKIAGGGFDEIEICGLCTDICVVSNALILKARLPETKIIVDTACCAGVSEVAHRAAILVMKSCQVEVRD
ncbi:MAG: cysteine hydrolase [Oscillospiraceae bacterium]|nr:cysteine hydrolase [Oscillospiraceae bacterium]